MFRALIHPSSGACNFSTLSPHWLCVLISMCVGVSVWRLGWYPCGRLTQHVSDINTSIIRSLRLFYTITTLVVSSCFDMCWNFGVAGWGGIRVAGCLNMFRTLIHLSSGACDFSILSPHWLCVLVSICVGVSLWLVGVVSVWQAASSCFGH